MQFTNHSYTIKNDPRWQQWAYAITQGTTLARRKWVGKNRPFRQREYEEGIGTLMANGILKARSDQNGNPGYRPNRAEGWQYIQEMAHGLKVLPPPPPSYSKALPKIRHFHHAGYNQSRNEPIWLEVGSGNEAVTDDHDGRGGDPHEVDDES